jgi:putative oxidoreductase
MLNRLRTLRERFLVKPQGTLASVALLLVRVSAGVVFLESGWGKLHNLDFFIGKFQEWGIPAPQLQAPFVAGLEFTGGCALLIGLCARLFAAPLIGTMVVAMLTVLKPEGPSEMLGLSEWHYVIFFVTIVLMGPGKFSVDHLLAKKLFAAPSPQSSPAAPPPAAMK